jgi:hypothetical protein
MTIKLGHFVFDNVRGNGALGANGYAQKLSLTAVSCVGLMFEVPESKKVGVQGINEHILRLVVRAGCRDDAGQLVDRRLHPIVLNCLESSGKRQGLHHVRKSRAIRSMIVRYGSLRTFSLSHMTKTTGLSLPTTG